MMNKSKLHTTIPIIITKPISFDNEAWHVSFYKEYTSIILDEKGNWKTDFTKLLENYVILDTEHDFRELITFECIPFLAAFLFKTREILLCTKRASRELFLIESIENAVPAEKELFIKNEEHDYIKLKKHIKKIITLHPDTFPSQIEKITQQYRLPDLLHKNDLTEVYKTSKRIAERLLEEINNYHPTIFERLTDYSLNMTANYALLRIHLLKFLAILPSLDYDNKGYDVKRIFLESMGRLVKNSQLARKKGRSGDRSPVPFCLLLIFKTSSALTGILPARYFAFLIRKIVRSFARRFIAGETIEKSTKSLSALKATKREATIDQLGELVVSEKEADRYCKNVITIIKGLSLQIKRGKKNESGILNANVSIKISALSSDFKPEEPEYTYNSVAPRLKQIFLAAGNEEVFINMDAEHYRCRDLAFAIFKRVLLETKELKDFESAGIAVQTYLRDAYPHLLEIIELAKLRNITMPIRLVKGAYWDAETIEASAFDYDAPEFLNKEESDLHFRQLIIMTMMNYPHVQLCIASHNPQDNCFAEALRKLQFSHLPKIEHQCLYMTCEALSVSMANGMGWVTRNYVPVGSLLVGMGYLVRRIMENSSMVGVLTIIRSQKKQEIVKEPEEKILEKIRNGGVVHDHSVMSLSPHFTNTTPIRLYLNDQRRSVIDHLNSFKKKLGQMYNQKSELNGQMQKIYSPSDPDTLVGAIRFANKFDTMLAIGISSKVKQEGSWARLNPVVRSNILLKAADGLLLRRLDLTALMIYEGGKAVREAATDVDEAIDFLNFYARKELHFMETHHNAIPRGVFAVVPPWNFPIAIPCGMIAAALAAGNSVILKSSKQTPLIAQLLVDIFHASGVPENILIHLPGPGEETGATLISDPRIDGIVFTGSKKVGTWIYHQAGKRMASSLQHNHIQYPVKVITEMGGKNAIIVTASAELDETVSSILYSCFGHAGQKCSAASRILVDERILNRFSERFKEACSDISVGKSYKLSSSINPVISKFDKQRLINSGHDACQEALSNGGKILVDRIDEALPGYCVAPLVLQIPSSLALAKEAYAQKELFGPIVHIIPYKTIDQAILIANSSEYALTAGVFSQSQDDIDYIIQKIEAGNIYVNRGCTGARVDIEPFGGFKFSGTGPKAGHYDYLKAFHLRLSDDHEKSTDNPVDLCEIDKVESLINLAVRSQLEFSKRTMFIKDGLHKIIENHDDIFPNTRISEKTNLVMFTKWLDSSMEKFLLARWPNRNIPGQLSYNDYSMIREQGILIGYSKHPHENSLYNLISAIAVGSGVTILAQGHDAYTSWKSICDHFTNSGFSEDSLKVVLAGEATVKKAIINANVSFVIIDGRADHVQKTLESILSIHNEDARYVRSIHSPMDGPTPPHWKEYLKQFVFPRSMAINTMRHGAPLEID